LTDAYHLDGLLTLFTVWYYNSQAAGFGYDAYLHQAVQYKIYHLQGIGKLSQRDGMYKDDTIEYF